MLSKHGSWFSHGSTPRAQIFHVYVSRIWCPSMGAGSPMGAHPGPRYFMYICLGYGVQAWELVLPWEHTQGPDIHCIFVKDMVSKHGSWFSHGRTPRAQIFHVYVSRIWCPSMGAGSPMGAHPGPRYFLYICIRYGVPAWELVLPWEHTQGPDISCIFV
jgi:hypothetical protein